MIHSIQSWSSLMPFRVSVSSCVARARTNRFRLAEKFALWLVVFTLVRKLAVVWSINRSTSGSKVTVLWRSVEEFLFLKNRVGMLPYPATSNHRGTWVYMPYAQRQPRVRGLTDSRFLYQRDKEWRDKLKIDEYIGEGFPPRMFEIVTERAVGVELLARIARFKTVNPHCLGSLANSQQNQCRSISLLAKHAHED